MSKENKLKIGLKLRFWDQEIKKDKKNFNPFEHLMVQTKKKINQLTW